MNTILYGSDILNTSGQNIVVNSLTSKSFNILNDITLGPSATITQNGHTITPTIFAHLSTIDQDLATTSNVQFTSANLRTGTIQSDSLTTFVVNEAGGTNIFTVDTNTPMVTVNTDLTVNGNITYNTITVLTTTNPEIKLADGNLTDTLDIGIYGEYSTNLVTPLYAGFYRDHTNGLWKIYDGLVTEPTTTVPGGYTLADLQVGDFIASTIDGSLTSGAQASITTLANLASVQGNSISGTQWGYLSGLNQPLSTASSPTFVTVTANLSGNVTGNVTGNVSGSAATVTDATQNAITTLPNLSSVASQSISGTQWGYLSGLNQPLSTASSPTFVTVTANLSGNVTGNVVGNVSGSAATVTNATQNAITTLPNVTSVGTLKTLTIQNPGVPTTILQEIIADQDQLQLVETGYGSGAIPRYVGRRTSGTQSSPTATNTGLDLISIEARGYTGSAFTDSVGKLYFTSAEVFSGSANGTNFTLQTTTSGTTSPATRLFISDAGVFSFFNGSTLQSVAGSAWQYVNSLNQSVASSASPTFVTVTANLSGNVTGNVTGNVSGSAATVTNAAQPAITSLGTLTGLTMGGTLNMNSNNITNGSTITATTLAGTLSTASQPNVTSLGTLTGLTMGGTLNVNSNNITNGSTITATTLAGTLSTASQPNITTLAGVTTLGTTGVSISVDGKTITSTQWNNYIGAMDQSVAIAATPTFARLSLNTPGSTYVSNMTGTSTNNIYDAIQGIITGVGANIISGSDICSTYITTQTNPTSAATWAVSQYIYPNSTPANAITISNNCGLYIATGNQSTGSGGSFTNCYGAYIQVPTGGSTSKTALYADNIAIGVAATTPPSGGLLVNGPVKLNEVTDNTNGNLVSTTYTPTLAAVTGSFTPTAVNCSYKRIGSVITVTGAVDNLAISSTNLLIFSMTLPFTRTNNFSSANDAWGSGSCSLDPATAASTVYCQANASSKLVYVYNYTSVNSTASRRVFFTFSYLQA